MTGKANNTTIVNAAVLDSIQQVRFSLPDNNNYQSRIDEHGTIQAFAIPLGAFLREENVISLSVLI